MIHLRTATKVDLFVLRDRDFAREEMRRRIGILVSESPHDLLMVATPEDMVLSKLERYEKGGCVSDRQWRDVTGILKHQGSPLDRGYMDRWADQLGLQKLLRRAWDESGLPGPETP